MRPSFERLSHLLVLLVIVSLATLPTWKAQAEQVGSDTPDINLKTVGSVTDDEVVHREEEAMSRTGYSVAEKRLLEQGDQFQFQAEVSRLMSLIVNSLYSNRDVFLRELISNASDALDKIRFQSLSDSSLLDSNPKFEIRIQPDPENNQLHIIDTGIGMTKEDMINNLGTIAKSGTSEFIAKAETASDTSNLIGQFGVGFYSAFLVADRVTVTSKHNDDAQHIWSSNSEGTFVVGEDPEGNTLGRGTKITLHLKDDALTYARDETLRSLVARYSEFINFPIYLYASHIEKHEIAVEPEADDFDSEPDDVQDDFDDYEVIEETVWEWELLNDVKPIWTRDTSEITDEEYINFYTTALCKSDDIEDPYSWVHFSAEGDLEFRAILYLPREVPDNMFDTSRNHDNRGIRLYVRRVYITDEFDTIIPKYLSFIKGIVDSSSLPLNVSREILQQDKSLRLMQKKLVRKAIAMIQKLAVEDPEAFEDFYEDFKINLKLGVLEDKPNQDRLAKLLRFHSSKSGSDVVSLDEYIENMKEGQDKIYFLAGESRAQVDRSPLLEKLVSNDYEVLYFTDAIDEYWTQTYNAYEGKKLINIAKDVDLDLDEPEEDKIQEEEEFQPLLDFFKATLKSKVSKVVLSKRLTTTPSALISTAYSYSANMERIQRAQTLAQGVDPFMLSKKVLELNPQHPLVQDMLEIVKTNPESEVASDMAQLLFDTAALHSGFALEDPSVFAKSIHRMMQMGISSATQEAPVHEEL